MKKVISVVFLFIILAGSAIMAQAPTPGIDANGYGQFNLKNGLQGLVNHDKTPAITALSVTNSALVLLATT